MKLFTGMQTLAAGMTFGLALSVAACGSDSDDSSSGSGGSGGTSSSSGGTSSGKGGSSTSSGGTSSSSGGTSGSCNPADPTGSMGTCQAYVDCAQTSCGTQYAACLGAGWESGNFSGGACETYMECASACDCSDSTCGQTCFDNAGSACTTCLTNDIASCVVANCFDEAQSCGGGTGGTGAGGTGAGGTSAGSKTCGDLLTCCNSMSGTDETDCMELYNGVMAGGDQACSAVYQIYQVSGTCQ